MACSSGSVGCGTMCSPKGSASFPEMRLFKSRGRRERSTRKRSGTSVARRVSRRALCNSHLVSPL